MTQDHMLKIAPLMISAFLAVCPGVASAQGGIRHAVDSVIRRLMRRDGIPGMAVGVLAHGHARVFDYGVLSLRTRVPVRTGTLFDIGSASKSFTATLASYAVAAPRTRNAPGTYRGYSKIGIGLLGVAAARNLLQRFATVMQNDLLPALGLNLMFVAVPAALKAVCAQRFTGNDRRRFD